MDFDTAIEVLSDKIVTRNGEGYIRVSDLKALNAEMQELQKAEEEKPKFKGFEAAKQAALKDKKLMEMFAPREPQAPAVGRVTNVGREETSDVS